VGRGVLLLWSYKYIFGGIATAVVECSEHYYFSAPTSGHPAVSATMSLMEIGVDEETAQIHLVDRATGRPLKAQISEHGLPGVTYVSNYRTIQKLWPRDHE
jgi:hypothetical protein